MVHRAVPLHAKMEEECCQRRRRGFAPSVDKHWRVHDDIHVGESWVAITVLLQHVCHEIPPAARGLPLTLPSHRLVARHASDLRIGGDVFGRHERLQPWVLLEYAGEGGAACSGDDVQDPRVIVAVLEGVERLGEHEVADDVEGHEVEPVQQVKHLAGHRPLAEPRDEQVDVALDDGLLLVHARVGEGVRELPAQAAVDFVRPADERLLVVLVVEALLLGPLGLAGAVLEDLREGDRPVHREAAGGDADDGAVPPVQIEGLDRHGPQDGPFPEERDVGHGIEPGPGVFGQGVEEEAVDHDDESPQDELRFSHPVRSWSWESYRDCKVLDASRVQFGAMGSSEVLTGFERRLHAPRLWRVPESRHSVEVGALQSVRRCFEEVLPLLLKRSSGLRCDTGCERLDR